MMRSKTIKLNEENHPMCRMTKFVGVVGATVEGTASDARGTIMVEYAVLLALVSVGCATAVAALGVPLVRLYLVQQAWLMLSVP